MSYKWKPSKANAREFAKQMQEIEKFCAENSIQQSRAGDSYYFELNGKKYRVSNHTIEASNRGAYRENSRTGEIEKVREKYHEDEENESVVYITASKTRIIEIYKNLAAGKELDRRGNIK